ncbi:ferric reductase-like transmembrane domain-containing protein [Skermania sp. ID1734]|uniref:ferredoxin reductase family protein n=1 Tax=Skermania sp. ID1734 TaxID=2597516 RepID=UPI001C8F2263|nr:ferric reductase-like transmembrane domain-containing protein [Skermania sp. ID1734]
MSRTAEAPVLDASPEPGPAGQGRREVCLGAVWALLLVVTSLWLADGGVHDLLDGAAVTALGRLAGLLASASLLMQVLVMARVPWIEQAWGSGDLRRIHRLVGFGSMALMGTHIALITAGYADASINRIWAVVVDFVVNEPGGLLAVAGTIALLMVVVTSVRVARRRLRYESWHLLHLYAYVGAGLALPHQLWDGQEFTRSTAASVFWWSLYGMCAGAVVAFRVVLPLWRSLRAPIRVLGVHHETPTVLTVTVGGPGVRYLHARGGQFFHWRFLGAPGWTRAHPYSLSAPPDGSMLRFTAAMVGNGSAALRHLQPGSRVLIEGPYGRLHSGTRTRPKVLLVGAGTGVAPLRALFESLPQRPGDVQILHRVRSRREAIFSDELETLAARYGADYRLVEGRRIQDRASWLPQAASGWADHSALQHFCPDVAEREVYICGPDRWAAAVRAAALRARVPARHIHAEYFHD